jgi:MoxR-like ATPase
MYSSKDIPTEVRTVEDVQHGCSIVREGYMRLREEIGQTIVGQKRVVDLVLLSIFANGHVLLEGPPGLGKTLLVKTIGEALQMSTGRIQCTADLMPADIVGTTIVDQNETTGKREFTFRKGPVFHNILLADEINRATPKCQSALLESMQERSVSVDGKTYELPLPFFVLATQNPIEQEGTYPLPEAQLDRFLLKVNVGFSSQDELHEIVNRTTAGLLQKVEVVVDLEFISAAQRFVQQIFIAPHIQDFITRLVLATHPGSEFAPNWISNDIVVGASPRAAQSIVACAKVATIIDGRYAVSHRDIRAVAVSALQHRIVRTFEAETALRTPSSIISRLIDEVSLYEAGTTHV